MSATLSNSGARQKKMLVFNEVNWYNIDDGYLIAQESNITQGKIVNLLEQKIVITGNASIPWYGFTRYCQICVVDIVFYLK